MAAIALTAEIRTQRGKGAAGRIRRTGRIPAIIYGAKHEPIMVSVNTNEFVKAMRLREAGERSIALSIQGEAAARMVMLREVQQHPITYLPLRIDFVVTGASGGEE